MSSTLSRLITHIARFHRRNTRCIRDWGVFRVFEIANTWVVNVTEMIFLLMEAYGSSTCPCSCSHQQALNDGMPVFAFIVHHLNVVQVGIGPVHQPAD